MLIEETILINSDIEKVWKIFTDLSCWEEWNSVLRDVSSGDECVTAGDIMRCCIRPFFFPLYFNAHIEEVIPRKLIVWTGKKFGISSRHEFRFEDVDNNVRVTSREAFKGLPAIFSNKFFPASQIRKLTLELLHDLKEAVESSGDIDNG